MRIVFQTQNRDRGHPNGNGGTLVRVSRQISGMPRFRHSSLATLGRTLAVLIGASAPCLALSQSTSPPSAPLSSPTRVALLDFGPPKNAECSVSGTLGITIDVADWREAIPSLESDKVEVVILRVNTPGGDVASVTEIQDFFAREFIPRFRAIAWIQIALNESAECILPVKEWVFGPDGIFGCALCRWPGCDGVRTMGKQLEERMAASRAAARNGGRTTFLADSLLIQAPLSATLATGGGPVIWTQGETGQIILNRKDNVFEIGAADAARCSLAEAIAAAPDDVVRALHLGDVTWTGQAAANGLDQRMRERSAALASFQRDYSEYKIAIDAVRRGENRAASQRDSAAAATVLDKLRQVSSKHPAMARSLCVTSEWLDAQSAELDRLSRSNGTRSTPESRVIPPAPVPDPSPPQSPAPPRR